MVDAVIDDEMEQRRRNDARKQRDIDLVEVLKTTYGRRHIWGQLLETNVFGPSYTGEALGGAYGEGRRSAGITLMMDCQRTAPRLYVQMLAEHLSLPPRAPAAPTPE